MDFAKQSIQVLKESHYKITGPRVAVLEALENAEAALSAHDLEERVPENIPINVVTIYRILELFEELGIVHRVHTKEGYVRCDFEKNNGCHYFAVCGKCGRTSEFINDQCEIEKLVPRNLPFKNLKHLSEIAGTCDFCSLSIKSKKT